MVIDSFTYGKVNQEGNAVKLNAIYAFLECVLNKNLGYKFFVVAKGRSVDRASEVKNRPLR